jgi:hypothetical protein
VHDALLQDRGDVDVAEGDDAGDVRCMNMVLGFEPIIWCSLTRESEQPVQSTFGVCFVAIEREYSSFGRNSLAMN